MSRNHEHKRAKTLTQLLPTALLISFKYYLKKVQKRKKTEAADKSTSPSALNHTHCCCDVIKSGNERLHSNHSHSVL